MMKSVNIYTTQYAKLQTEMTDKWCTYIYTYTHICPSQCTNMNMKVLWNQEVHRDGELMANRPHIIIKNKKEKTPILIDVTIAADRNVMQNKEEEKQYRNLCIEIQWLWNLNCIIIPAIIATTGIVTKGLKKNVKPGKYSMDSLDKKAILGTSDIIKKVPQPET